MRSSESVMMLSVCLIIFMCICGTVMVLCKPFYFNNLNNFRKNFGRVCDSVVSIMMLLVCVYTSVAPSA